MSNLVLLKDTVKKHLKTPMFLSIKVFEWKGEGWKGNVIKLKADKKKYPVIPGLTGNIRLLCIGGDIEIFFNIPINSNHSTNPSDSLFRGNDEMVSFTLYAFYEYKT